ncbi:hypothetical protein RND81_12G161900 [Saponaria officinalis]|uniref:C3H1-type domain-containing protein n=1 Tax=Saponaria officinalis TaxID=3572 RepID=A0AAW1HBI1_SAPOF
MTIGKYYCDYCDKEFQDTSAARKRHLQSVVHQRNRKLWYDSLSFSSDPNQLNVAAHAFGKGVCNRFVNTGFCPYGDSCKYHHPKHSLQGPAIQGTSGTASNSQVSEGGSLQGQVVRESFGMSLGNLPPSLMPPPEAKN